ncbi:DegT/DnrJ/EryC1/StrS aminotransferase family protein [Candidatus Saccharibacteria bacterium]|nr:DegT/DnrJ/EryC1/StrS aminotransferase family protein [Candidatus Saccharibacteria bacterium]
MKHFFLGMAANYGGSEWAKHTFAVGRKWDCDELKRYLAKRYSGEAILCKNGRSALCLGLKAYFEPGDAVLVNGFTCYAVYEAVKAAGLVPVFVDISKDDLNFDMTKLEASIKSGDSLARQGHHIKGVIVQNTLGNPVDIKAVEKFAKKHHLTIIEDLAHSAGVRYDDKREAGTVGAAAVWSFGKDKAIDTISGGAVVLRAPIKHKVQEPSDAPRPSDYWRARMYPTFGVICRGLSYVRLGGALMRGLVKIHWVEKSADNKLDLKRRPSKFEAKLALEQLKKMRKNGEPPLREFCFVRDRAELLVKLQKKGYYFGGFWYEKPVSPTRYYKKVHFPEKECPNAVWVAEHILNLPTYYTRRDLMLARRIIKKYLEEESE